MNIEKIKLVSFGEVTIILSLAMVFDCKAGRQPISSPVLSPSEMFWLEC